MVTVQILENMAPVLVWTLVSLVVAVIVVAVASSSPGAGRAGSGHFGRDLRSAFRKDPETGTRVGVIAQTRREMVEAADVETSSVEDIFSVGRTDGPDYVHPDEIAGTVARVTQRAVRGVGSLARR